MLETILFIVGALVFLFIVSMMQDRLSGDRMGFRGAYDWMMPAAIILVVAAFAVWKLLQYRALG